MKIAYVILAHKDPAHIARLCRKITKNTDNHAFVHVDQKVDILTFEKLCAGIPQVHFTSKRFSIYWGGFNSVIATVETYREALSYAHFDYYQILQGLDYPICSNREIDTYLGKHQGREFIRAIDDTEATELIDIFRYEPHWNFDSDKLSSKILKYFNIVQLKILKHIFCVKKRIIDVDGKPFHIYRGWAHFALSNDAVKYCVDFYDKHPEFNQYFRHIYSSDESYFHTIIFNSPFLSKVIDGRSIPQSERSYNAYLNLTYFEYPKEGVVIFTKSSDYKKLRATGYLFFRKASSESKDLLDYIDQQHAIIDEEFENERDSKSY